jgi:hypothetical protein
LFPFEGFACFSDAGREKLADRGNEALTLAGYGTMIAL